MTDRERLSYWLGFIFESLAKRLEEQARELRECI